MKRTILAIGDTLPTKKVPHLSYLDRSLLKFIDYMDLLFKKSIDLNVCDYQALLKGNLPRIDTHSVKAMLFFPYSYWNRHIEKRSQDGRIYGGRAYGEKFKNFSDMVNSRLRKAYKRQNLSFVNPPGSIKLDRDKKQTKLIFKKKGIPTPILYKIKKPEEIIDLIDKGQSLFLKPRFGAMGKGLTYLAKDGWYTNFLYRSGNVISRGFDYGWDFMKVTGKLGFLEKLIRNDFIVEEAIDLPMIGRKKFDLRCYCIYGKVPYMYARSIPAKNFVTNWSQGGKIEGKSFLAKIPKKRLVLAKKYALLAAKALGLNYAGVDIVFSKDYRKVYVLEAHSFPSYETGFDLMRYLINHL